jgi:hypothetical protein
MNYETLKTIVDANCVGMTDEEAVAYLNVPRVAVPRPTMMTERGLYALLGPEAAEAILQALEAAGEVNPVVKRALSWLKPPSDGIDLGDASTRGVLDALVTATVLTAEQVAALKGLAETTMSLVEAAGLGSVHLGDIQNARAL